MRDIKVNGYTIRYCYNVADHMPEYHVSRKNIGYFGFYHELSEAIEFCNNPNIKNCKFTHLTND